MSKSFETKVVHNSLKQDAEKINSKATPIYQTSAYTFETLEDLEGYFEGKSPYLYTRNGNPNTDELGHAVAQLEGAPAGMASSSGMSAILCGILAAVGNGEHIVAAEDTYGGTYQLLTQELKTFGIEVTLASFDNLEEVEGAIQGNTKLLYSESVTNPFLRVENIKALVDIAERYQLKTMIDNTFATPYLLHPYEEGVDLVVHSATKYIGGHSDVSAGVLVGREELIEKARGKMVALGANLSPFEAWLGQRGLKTLALRMKQQSENADYVAESLRNHTDIKHVYYPAYVSEKGNGAIITIELNERCDMDRFYKSLGWIKIVPSLAGVETTVSYPKGTSHRALTEEQQEKIGINEHVVRISIGIEGAKDILAQLGDAIEASLHEA
ncbi:methionine gamma-lyase [Thalassobacillus devorans]|uniref:Methionine gamma-lyase n=1 Tax=Thalassobacillus devorans TaxID=279813 RepID=A0ABQ1PP47_9BACI|nr:PLP-dependent aspartate aminotransferase family protein [Thalassobacillus devorans]NIK30393.1 cystathionine beta-lyase/cystathionine gamma-synthase [Thalassobacillus devorans]GGD00632.1 methionine gamma-lyase [Thalassobacillus devorans]